MRMLLALPVAIVAAVTVGAVGVFAQDDGTTNGAVRVELRDAQGQPVGIARLDQTAQGTVDVRVHVQRGLRSGWHGFHVHAVGRCDAPTFSSAGGHFKSGDQVHGRHAGDLAPLLVKLNGTATSRVTTDGFRLADLRDADGSALIVHLGPDNFANIPPRYAPAGPDEETRNTGDSGGRAACGVIAPANG
jgi:Cu-Zn family superoxide dismutase